MSVICRNFLALVVIITIPLSVFAQTKTDKPKEPDVPAEIENILLNARTLKPELTADIFLKIAASGEIKSIERKKQLLEEAFYLAFQAKEKVPRRIASFEGQVLTFRPTFISNAHKYKLDTLSLQIRIVSEMLKIDRVRAFELFNGISPDLSLKPLSCQDFLLYEVSDFYSLVGEIAKKSFTPEQIEQGQRTAFLSNYIEKMSSPSQISPVVKMLSSIDLRDDEKLNLVAQFAKSVRKISGDDRSFSYEMNFAQTNRAVYDFSRTLFFSSPLYDEFRRSYKDFLTKNLQGNRCSDNVEYEKVSGKAADENKESNIKTPFYIYEINKAFYKDSPVSIEETKFSEIEKTIFPVEYFTSIEASRIFDKFRKLQKREDENKSDSEIEESSDRQEAFSNLLNDIDEWKTSHDEDETDLFHQKSLIYRLLIREAPTFALKETIVKKYLKLLNQSEIQTEFISEWFLEFNDLLKELREINSPEERQKLFDVVKSSNNTAINIYLKLENIPKKEKDDSTAKAVTPSN